MERLVSLDVFYIRVSTHRCHLVSFIRNGYLGYFVLAGMFFDYLLVIM